MHRIVEHPGDTARIPRPDGLKQGVGHVRAVHPVVDEQLRVVRRGVRMGRGAAQVLGLQERIGRLDELEADLPHHDLPIGRHLFPVGLQDTGVLPRVDRTFRRIGMNVVQADAVAQLIAAAAHPPRLFGSPDRGVGTDQLHFPGQPFGVEPPAEIAHGLRPQTEIAVGGRPEAVGLVDEVVVTDAVIALFTHQPGGIGRGVVQQRIIHRPGPGVQERSAPVAEHHRHAARTAVVEDVRKVFESAPGVEPSVAHDRGRVGHHADKGRPHEIEAVIELRPVGVADLDATLSVVERIRVPLDPVADVAAVDDAVGVDTHHDVAFPGGFSRAGPQQRRRACEQYVSEVFHRHRSSIRMQVQPACGRYRITRRLPPAC